MRFNKGCKGDAVVEIVAADDTTVEVVEFTVDCRVDTVVESVTNGAPIIVDDSISAPSGVKTLFSSGKVELGLSSISVRFVTTGFCRE